MGPLIRIELYVLLVCLFIEAVEVQVFVLVCYPSDIGGKFFL